MNNEQHLIHCSAPPLSAVCRKAADPLLVMESTREHHAHLPKCLWIVCKLTFHSIFFPLSPPPSCSDTNKNVFLFQCQCLAIKIHTHKKILCDIDVLWPVKQRTKKAKKKFCSQPLSDLSNGVSVRFLLYEPR